VAFSFARDARSGIICSLPLANFHDPDSAVFFVKKTCLRLSSPIRKQSSLLARPRKTKPLSGFGFCAVDGTRQLSWIFVSSSRLTKTSLALPALGRSDCRPALRALGSSPIDPNKINRHKLTLVAHYFLRGRWDSNPRPPP
jgi:hypothetical protein